MASKEEEEEHFPVQLFLEARRREELDGLPHLTPFSFYMIGVYADLDAVDNSSVPELHRVVHGCAVVVLGQLLGVTPPLITDEYGPGLDPFSDKRDEFVRPAFLRDENAARRPRFPVEYRSRIPTTQMLSVTSWAPRWYFLVWR